MSDRMAQAIQALIGVHGDIWAMDEIRMYGYLSMVDRFLRSDGNGSGNPNTQDVYIHEALDGRSLCVAADTLNDKCFAESACASALRAAKDEARYVGVLSLQGPITPKSSALSEYLGGTPLNRWLNDLQQMVSMPNVGAVIVDVDSPGGSVAGIIEAAEVIRDASKVKPIHFIANNWMASAAYWLSSQGTKVWSVPSGDVGSIGVYSLHLDFSKYLESNGIKPTFIQAGEFKTDGNPLQPLSDSAKEEMQESVDHFYGLFIKEVAGGRNSSQTKVREEFGKGRMMRAEVAHKLGMTDGTKTFNSLLADVSRQVANKRRAEVAYATRIKEIEAVEATLPADAGSPVAPFPNDHACRLKDPADFEKGSFRSMDRHHNGKAYRVIIGRMKGESTTTEQAFRYRKDSWTADEAREHCQDHDGEFEAASGDE